MTHPIIYNTARTEYLTVSAFAQHFDVSKMTIYRLIENREISAHRIGRSLRIPVAELKRYKRATYLDADFPYSDEAAS